MMRILKKKKFSFKKSRQQEDKRLIFLISVFFLFALLMIVRLFNIQILQHSFYEALASGQHDIYTELFPKRGEIYMQDTSANKKSSKLYPYAINQELTLVYAQPKNVEEPEEVAEKIAPILELEKGDILLKLSKKDDPYEPLKHEVEDSVVDEIKELDLKGIGFAKESVRFYPEKNIGAHVLGFVGFKENERCGQYGLEGYFDGKLKGKEGFLKTEKDVSGSLIGIAERNFKSAQDGSDLVLTLDHTIQFMACDLLSKEALRHGAEGGSLIIMNPETGAVLAMCNYPDYNPNDYSEVENINLFNNSAIFNQYEPGSVFKAITMAAALNEKKVNPNTIYNDEGSVKIGPYTIKNSDGESYGLQTMTEVLEKSLNTGAIFAAEQVGREVFRKYLKEFGFGKLTGIELDTEASGDISSLDKNGDIYTATASFGQGITVTPLQMVTAFSTIANGGKLVKPYIVDKIIRYNGEEIKTQPQIVSQVISPRSATLLGGMLVSAVRNGYGKKAGVPGYYIAGKTGTAQVPHPEKKGYSDKTIHSFVGFGPVDNPVFAMIVKLDDPKDVKFAADSAAPLFGQLADFLLKYYQVPPEE